MAAQQLLDQPMGPMDDASLEGDFAGGACFLGKDIHINYLKKKKTPEV